jgi:hypothetical protein
VGYVPQVNFNQNKIFFYHIKNVFKVYIKYHKFLSGNFYKNKNKMTKEEKLIKLESLKNKANELKKEVDYFNALQLA